MADINWLRQQKREITKQGCQHTWLGKFAHTLEVTFDDTSVQ